MQARLPVGPAAELPETSQLCCQTPYSTMLARCSVCMLPARRYLATSANVDDVYDVVVVGAGMVGAALAALLSEWACKRTLLAQQNSTLCCTNWYVMCE